MDAQVGRVLDALERLGLDENTVVLFTSDHGYHMGEHDSYQKTTLFENATRVPLIISVPGMNTAGQSTQALTESLDFYPTLRDVCGLTGPSILSGVSMAPVLEDPNASPRSEALTQYGNGYTIRTDRYRYTEWGENGSDGAELYDHASDPAEMVNLANRAESADTIAELSQVLRRRVAAARQAPAGLEQIPPKPNEGRNRRGKAARAKASK
jgi:arylsulfatase A-like enzyme